MEYCFYGITPVDDPYNPTASFRYVYFVYTAFGAQLQPNTATFSSPQPCSTLTISFTHLLGSITDLYLLTLDYICTSQPRAALTFESLVSGHQRYGLS